MKEFITAGILLITSIIAFVISIRSFNEKGILLSLCIPAGTESDG